jgi:hypothetical protein
MIKIKLMGGLGNQMFQYSFGLSIAKQNSTKLLLDTTYLLDRTPRANFVFRDYDLDIFKLDSNIYLGTINEQPIIIEKILNNLLPSKYKSYYKEKHFEFNNQTKNLRNPNLYLEGYWQSPKYFAESENEIKKSFVYNIDFDDSIMQMRDKILSEDSICINVRRGDFVNNDFHGTMGLNYYLDAINYLKLNLNANFKIYVFSDDIKWCEQNLKFNYATEFVNHSYKGYKFSSYLYLMQSCKYFIIPNSSFAWWAAFLSDYSNKIVIAPKKWFNNDIDTSDLIPNSWIRI